MIIITAIIIITITITIITIIIIIISIIIIIIIIIMGSALRFAKSDSHCECCDKSWPSSQ